MRNIGLFSLCLSLASCGIYKSNFDCPAGKGIGCARVGDVLDMIVEREDGEDLFIKDQGAVMQVTYVEGPAGELVLEEAEKQPHFRKRKKRRDVSLELRQGSGGEMILEENPENPSEPSKEINSVQQDTGSQCETCAVPVRKIERVLKKKKATQPALQLVRGSKGELVLVDEKAAKGR